MMRAGRVAILALWFVGCARVPVTHYYVLEPQHAGRPAAAAAAAGLTIGIEPFHVDPPYDQDRIVYRPGQDSVEVGYYAYHRWAAPMSRMLPPVVAAAFGDVVGVAAIEPAVPGRIYDATLRGRVLALEEIDGPDGVRVGLRLTLDLDAADGTPLWSEALGDIGDTEAADEVSQVVTRMRALLDRLLAESRPGLERALHRD